jgi:hypothetical protein
MTENTKKQKKLCARVTAPDIIIQQPMKNKVGANVQKK